MVTPLGRRHKPDPWRRRREIFRSAEANIAGPPDRVAQCGLCLDTSPAPCAVTGGRNGAMSRRFIATIFAAGVSFAVIAIPADAADDIEAKAQICAGCHGENGVPTDPKTIPIIWGQQQSYLVKQLHDYRSGDRDNPIMSPIAKGLVQEDLRKIAAYFAAKPWPAQHAAATSASAPTGI